MSKPPATKSQNTIVLVVLVGGVVALYSVWRMANAQSRPEAATVVYPTAVAEEPPAAAEPAVAEAVAQARILGSPSAVSRDGRRDGPGGGAGWWRGDVNVSQGR